MEIIHLNFMGPFSFINEKNSIFLSSIAYAPGIYLWTVQQEKDKSFMIHYIGESINIAKRQKEHLINILGLNYGIFDPILLKKGFLKKVWCGLWRDNSNEAPIKAIKIYKDNHEIILKYLSVIDIFFAKTNVDTSLRKHIEGCIGYNIRLKHPKASTLYPKDNKVWINKKEKYIGKAIISCNVNIVGLDKNILL